MPINFDAIRLFALVAIVALHVSANGVNHLAFAHADWWLATSINALCRASVPLFLMLSGALLLRHRICDRRQYYLHRWERLSPALIGWSLFYLLWSAAKALVKQQPYSVEDALVSLLSGQPYYHLWFVFMLVGIYIVLPFMQRLWLRQSSRQRLFTACVLLATQQLGLYGYFVVDGPATPWPVWFIAYLPYVWLGAVLADAWESLNRRGWTPLMIITPTLLFLCSALAISYFRFWQQQTFGAEPFYYSMHRLSMPVLISAVCLWMLLGHAPPTALTKPLKLTMLPVSIHFYCCHPLYIDLTEWFLQGVLWDYWLKASVQILLVLIASFITALTVDKVLHQSDATINGFEKTSATPHKELNQ